VLRVCVGVGVGVGGWVCVCVWQVDLKLLIRGVLGFDDSISFLSRVNPNSHQMLKVPQMSPAARK